MPDCDYCGESFDGEDAYLDHLAAEHEGELRSIDQRRVADHQAEGERDWPVGPIVLVGLLVLAGGVVVYVTFLMGGGGGGVAFQDAVTQPTGIRTVHMHGPITVTVGGQAIDFSQPKYQYGQTRVDAFHFEGGNGDRYHLHAKRVTLEFALESVDIGVTNTSLSFDGTLYERSDGDTVRYLVDGQRVNPESYVLKDGDTVRVVARER